MTSIAQEYQAAVQKAAYFPLTSGGYLCIQGDDRASFLQRQTTNDIALLNHERAQLSVLTSPTARILDVLYLLQENDAIGLITLPGFAASTARFLKSRIFFMDKIELTDVSEQFNQVDVFGPQAGRALESMGIKRLPDVDELIQVNSFDFETRIFRMQPAIGLGYRLLLPEQVGQTFIRMLTKAEAICVNNDTYRLMQIEGGIPVAGAELNEAFTPLETRLEVAVSGTKGCYTGQEVIARQVTYDKVTQRLCGLRLGSPIQAGARLWVGEKPAGVITSSSLSPRFGPIALAVIKRPHDRPGETLEAMDERGLKIRAQIAELPFTE